MRPEDPTYFPDPKKYPGVWVLLVLMVVGLAIYVGVNAPNEDPADTPTQDLDGSAQNYSRRRYSSDVIAFVSRDLLALC